MSASARHDPRSLLQAIRRWFRARPDRSDVDFVALGDSEVKHIADDLSVSTTELYKLARSDSSSADLLKQRLSALDLDCEEVGFLMPARFAASMHLV